MAPTSGPATPRRPTAPEAAPDAGARRLLAGALRHSTGRTVAVCLFSTGSAAAAVALPAVLGHTLDLALEHAAGLPRAVALCAVAARPPRCCSTRWWRWTSGVTTARGTAWLRRRGVDHLLALAPHRAADRFSPGDLVTRLTGNAADAGAAPTTAATGLAAVLTPVGGLVALALTDLWLAAVFLAGVPLLALPAAGLRPRLLRQRLALSAGAGGHRRPARRDAGRRPHRRRRRHCGPRARPSPRTAARTGRAGTAHVAGLRACRGQQRHPGAAADDRRPRRRRSAAGARRPVRRRAACGFPLRGPRRRPRRCDRTAQLLAPQPRRGPSHGRSARGGTDAQRRPRHCPTAAQDGWNCARSPWFAGAPACCATSTWSCREAPPWPSSGGPERASRCSAPWPAD